MKYKSHKLSKLLLLILIVALLVTGLDYLRISKYQTFLILPEQRIETNESQVYFDLANGSKDIDWKRLDGTLQYIKNEYDCSDFRMVNLIRILYDFGDSIPEDYKKNIEDVLFNFRYWLDEPGENSMCYWSENHQILFAMAEYLVGQKYSDTTFQNSDLTGEQHRHKARARILDWLNMRWNHGFTEFYSNVYYKEDIAALINLIDFAHDEEIVKKCQIILDLIFYDVATQSTNKMFVSVSGRAYENSRKGGEGATLGGLTQYYWGNGEKIGVGMMYGLMLTHKYELPPVLKEIALDTNAVVIKQSNGLDILDLKEEGYYGVDSRSLMMQWGMEAFVNPTVVRNSLSHIRSYNMFSNGFLGDFKILDFTLLRLFRLEPFIVKIINPQYLGTAIQKGDTYTYRTKDYSVYTVQSYQPGSYGDQQHISGMNIKENFSIFHCHPAVEKEVKMHSPNYWVGYGHLPHSVQYENVNLSIYNIPTKQSMMEKDLLDYTHAYFPKERLDSVLIDKNFVFGKKGDTYCALVGTNDFRFREGAKDDIIQDGNRVYWITEAGSKSQDGTFNEFINRIQNNQIRFDERNLELFYESRDRQYELKYDAHLAVNGQAISTDYNRFDSPYVQSGNKSDTLRIKFNDKSLYLDFKNMDRKF